MGERERQAMDENRKKLAEERDRIVEMNGGQDKPDCRHIGWDFRKHGRCCFACGAFVVDFGD
jgi:hypothetical protein